MTTMALIIATLGGQYIALSGILFFLLQNYQEFSFKKSFVKKLYSVENVTEDADTAPELEANDDNDYKAKMRQ